MTITLPADKGIEILRTEVGSTLHGTGLGVALEDHDEMGIFVEHKETTIGLERVEHWQYRSQPEGQRSGPGDTDLICYSLRKWASLALSGNPSVLLPLFAPQDKVIRLSPLGAELRAHPQWFASRTAGKSFLGYMERQRQRMQGLRGRAGRIRLQPDGETDWKYAMHMLRLGYQGVEFLTTGQLTLPMPADPAVFLREVRQGLYSADVVLQIATSLEARLFALLEGDSPLPEVSDRRQVQRFVVNAHLEIWNAPRFEPSSTQLPVASPTRT